MALLKALEVLARTPRKTLLKGQGARIKTFSGTSTGCEENRFQYRLVLRQDQLGRPVAMEGSWAAAQAPPTIASGRPEP